MKGNEIINSVAVVYKKAANGRTYWFLAKDSQEGDWEFPKIVARKAESSVRGAIRLMAEKGGITAKVLEEAGRFRKTTTVNGKTIKKIYLFYLMKMQASSESIGFVETNWVEHSTALKRIKDKKEKEILKNAKVELATWRKKRAEIRKNNLANS